MFKLIQFWVAMCLFRARPQDFPASFPVLAVSVLGYFLVNTLLSLVSEPPHRALIASLLDMMVLYLFVRVALLVRQKPERLMQTLSALTGSGAVMGFVALPVVAAGVPGAEAGEISAMVALVWLILLTWSIAVFGHILRHALSVVLPIGMAVAILYIILSYRVMQAFLTPAVT